MTPGAVVRRAWSAGRLHGDRELHASVVVDLRVEDLVLERFGGGLLEEHAGAVLLQDPVAGQRLRRGDDVQGRQSSASWLIRRPASAPSMDWSTIVLTTVLAFSVRVSTGCVSFVMRLRMSRPPCLPSRGSFNPSACRPSAGPWSAKPGCRRFVDCSGHE